MTVSAGSGKLHLEVGAFNYIAPTINYPPSNQSVYQGTLAIQGTPLQTVTRAVMDHVAVDNLQLCSTHTHIRAYVHGYTTAPCTRSTKADQLTVDLARRAHQSPGRLVDEDGLRGLPLAQQTGQEQSGVVAFLVWELGRFQEPLNRRRREDGLRLPVKSVTGLFVTLFSKSESRFRKEDADSRLRCALEAVRGQLAEHSSRSPFCR